MSISIKAKLIVLKMFAYKVNKVLSCSYFLSKDQNDN